MANQVIRTSIVRFCKRLQNALLLVGAFLSGLGVAGLANGSGMAVAWLIGGIGLCVLGVWGRWPRKREKEVWDSVEGAKGVALEGIGDNVLWQDLSDLLDANDEEGLIRKALEKAVAFSGASGATFIPLDEWNQPLRVYAVGKETMAASEGWEKSLAQPKVRLSCKQCQVYRAVVGQGCSLFQGGISEAKVVECLPLKYRGRTVVVVNFFSTQPDFRLGEKIRHVLENFFSVILVGLELYRLKGRETAIYSQVLGSRVRHPDLDSTLRPLVWRLMRVSGCEGAALYLPKNEIRTLPTFLTVGHFPLTEPEGAREVWSRVLRAAQAWPERPQYIPLEPDGTQGWVFRLVSSQSGDLGVLMLYGPDSSLQGEAALERLGLLLDALVYVIETEQMNFDLAYRAVMQERLRLAREIHDGLAQMLAYLKLNAAQMIQVLNQEKHARLETLLHQHYQALSEIYLETRQVMDNLRFSPQEDMNAWIRQVAANVAEGADLQIECILPEKAPDLPLEVQAQILRIIQEALNNIRKHAHASRAWISLSSWNRDWVLEIGDNGVGFSPEDVPQFSQHGLRGMRERAELIGAEFQVISRPYQGTIIRLQVPFRIEESLV